MTLEYLRGAGRHRIGQRKPRLDIGQHGVIHMHVIFKAITRGPICRARFMRSSRSLLKSNLNSSLTAHTISEAISHICPR